VDEVGLETDPWARQDAQAFIRVVGNASGERGIFEPDKPITMARAPGRLDVMGGIADYSGSLVLQWPLAEATFVAVQAATDGVVRVISMGDGTDRKDRSVEMASDELLILAQQGYGSVGEHFASPADATWGAYPLGVLAVLMREFGVTVEDGLRVLLHSAVPEGKGVSSSAALEVASMMALAELFGVALEGPALARWCQVAENSVVGAPCGIMDQMTAAVGREGRLLELLCQPAQIQGYARVPEAIGLWGIDSGVRHAVSGSDYISVRCGAFMGYRILAEAADLVATEPDAAGRVEIEGDRWGGYLANVGVDEYASRFGSVLPESMSGQEFTLRFGGTTDPVTRVDPGRNYAVRRPTEHPIQEHARVSRFVELLSSPVQEGALEEMGALMFESHASYSACGLGCEGTDLLVEMVREAGPAMGLYGAKITGGGSGGTVAILGRASASEAVLSLARRFREKTGHSSPVFYGSSSGAVWTGTRLFDVEGADG
jgi:galactokinase